MTAVDTHARRSGLGTLGTALLVLTGLAILAALYGRIMGYVINRDEMLYATPPGFPDDWRLYRDVFYNHVPYSAWVFDAVHDLTGLGLLHSARLVVFAAWIALLAGTAILVRRLSGSALVALLATVALVTNATLLSQVGAAATNNLLPLPLAVIGTGLFLVCLTEHRYPFATLFAAGACLAIACGIKASAIAFVLPVAVATLVAPVGLPFGQRLRRVVLPVLLGGLAGGAPLLYVLATDTERVLAHVVGFHGGPHIAYWAARIAEGGHDGVALGLAGKVQLAYDIWLSGTALLLLAVTLTCAAARIAAPDARALPATAISVVLGGLLCTAAMSFLPSPGFEQYYAPPLVLLPLLLALVARDAPASVRALALPMTAAAVALMLVLGAPRLGPGLLDAARPGATTAAKVERGGAALADAVAASARPDGPVATFMPIYPLEAGLPVYREFATGQFAYRIADVTAPDLARHYAMAGPADLDRLFSETPPAAFLLGYEPDLEQPLVDWARANGYDRQDAEALNNRYGNGYILVRSGNAS